jgi:hypothetical protein
MEDAIVSQGLLILEHLSLVDQTLLLHGAVGECSDESLERQDRIPQVSIHRQFLP